MKELAKEIIPLIVCLLVSIPSVAAQSSSTARDLPAKNMRQAIDKSLARESLHEWKKIQWRTNASQALREAQAQSKPIFVFFMVKQKAPSPASWTGQQNDMGKT
jgi:predicted PurR-regulated permease PerM